MASTRQFRSLVAVALLAGILVMDSTAGAQADDFDFWISAQPDQLVTDAIFRLNVLVTNTASTAATGATIEISLPPEANIEGPVLPCSVRGSQLTCPMGYIGPRTNTGAQLMLSFDEQGTYPVSATLTVEDPEVVIITNTDLVVGPENADLSGLHDSTVALTGTTVQVYHSFRNLGPTAAANATVAGTFPTAGTVDLDSFRFGISGDRSAEDCSVTATGFTCFPANAEFFDGWVDSVGYELHVPATPAVLFAEATITGRNDPNSSNNTSTFTIEVEEPKPDLTSYRLDVPDFAFSGEAATIVGAVQNVGRAAAANVAVEFVAPADWSLVAANTEPAGMACTNEAAGSALRCTLPELGPYATIDIVVAATPPTGQSGAATITLTASTSTTEGGERPNSISRGVNYQPFVAAAITVSPDTDLVDDQSVQVEAVGLFTTNLLGAVMCQQSPTTGADCDLSTLKVVNPEADRTASFSYNVSRTIVTPNGGFVDCAAEACDVTVGDLELTITAGAPVTFVDTPLPPLPNTIELIGPHHLEGLGAPGSATVRVELSCTEDDSSVVVHFELSQQSPSAVEGASNVEVACEAGETVTVPSDLISGFSAGTAQATVEIADRRGVARDTDAITIRSFEEVRDELQAALAGPDGAAVGQQFLAALLFRTNHNPILAAAFREAIRNLG